MQDNTMPQAVAKANYVRIAPRKVQIGTDPQENKSESSGQSVQNQQEDVAHHPGAQGSGISEEEVKQWDRKLIPPVLESV